MATRAHGKEAVVHLDDSAGVSRDISIACDTVTAPTNIDQADVSGFTQDRKSYIGGQIDTPIAIGGKLDAAANAEHAAITSLIGGTVGYTFMYQPKGTPVGMPKLSGEVLLQDYQVQSSLSAPVTWSAKLVPADSTGLLWSTN